MSTPHTPRTATALPLDDSSHNSSRNIAITSDPSLGFRSRPIPVPAPVSVGSSSTYRLGKVQTVLSTSPSGQYSLPDVSVTTPALVHFRANTIAPTPPLEQGELAATQHAGLSTDAPTSIDRRSYSPVGSLRISTEFGSFPNIPGRRESFNGNGNGNGGSSLSSSRGSLSLKQRASTSSLRPISRTPSLKTALANSLGSVSGTSSLVPSPIISAMGSVTPLPSPLMSGDSPGPWKRLSAGSASPPQHRLKSVGEGSVLVTNTGESIDAALSNGAKRKMYSALEPGDKIPSINQPHHTRNRSVSDYHPDQMGTHTRQASKSGLQNTQLDGASDPQPESHMRRELHLAECRGLTSTLTQPPTPPPSESSRDSADGLSKPKNSRSEYFEALGRNDRKRRRWRSLRLLGQGTFSRVMLATSQIESEDDETEAGNVASKSELDLDRKTLVAVKVCEHGPRGGASEERVEMSLKRELEMMLTIHHPSLVDLKAWQIEPSRAILVLSYCPGGDLFDIATTHRAVLQESLLRRIFAELVGAVSYLHERRIVHRDIKLENVLVNLTPAELADPTIDWATYTYSVVILTDLGLSRRIADDEKLETRCGSDDYAAPEVIMGQPYDGRATDAWSLGVLLYALLEARLPFDPHPGMSDAHRMRSRTSHRIARVEWKWIQYAGEDTDNDGDEAKFKEKGLLGAMEITEGLLKRARSRWSVVKVAKTPWVAHAIKVEGGLRFREEREGAEV
ncbi:kinase-like domain-containing protein [Dactylonectria estremocensis]|uniref:Kinase-like domain-containing protein n=1 Tax=Dactylonectria estremocensis TaxID=1079267 RepID=A0A9P9J2Z0_9HYPO|nr:kinase-like domain-containing protein [Dactylonectria estremocensis]